MGQTALQKVVWVERKVARLAYATTSITAATTATTITTAVKSHHCYNSKWTLDRNISYSEYWYVEKPGIIDHSNISDISI